VYLIAIDEPFEAFVRRFEHEIWRQVDEKSPQLGVQLFVDLFVLNGTLERNARRGEERCLEGFEGVRVDLFELFEAIHGHAVYGFGV
jgi:hypothetical protein